MVLPATTADELAAIVADLRDMHDDLALPDTVAIQRKVEVKDARGGTTWKWETCGYARASIDPSASTGSGEYVAGSIERVDLSYTITLPYDTSVTEQQRIVAGSRVFEIASVRSGEGYGIAVEVECREVSRGSD